MESTKQKPPFGAAFAYEGIFGYSFRTSMTINRKQGVAIISLVVLTMLAIWGCFALYPRFFSPYAGLVTHIDVQMDDATRSLIQHRLAIAQASIEANEQSGATPDMNLYLTIAEQYHLLGDLIASREAYEKYLTLNPISYVAWNAYGSLLETMGDYAKAGPALLKAIEGLRTEEFYRDYAAFLTTYYPEKQVEYKQFLDRAYAELGQTSWTMQALGDWYFWEHDCALGRDHYDVAEKLEPQNENIQKDAHEKYRVCQDDIQ